MSEQRGGSMLKLERMRTAFDRAFRNEQNENLQKIEDANNVLESKMDSLISGEIDNVALQTDIEQKLNDLETQYAPKLTEVDNKTPLNISDFSQFVINNDWSKAFETAISKATSENRILELNPIEYQTKKIVIDGVNGLNINFRGAVLKVVSNTEDEFLVITNSKNVVVNDYSCDGQGIYYRGLLIGENNDNVKINNANIKNISPIIRATNRKDINSVGVYVSVNNNKNIFIENVTIDNIRNNDNGVIGDSIGSSRGILFDKSVQVDQVYVSNVRIKNVSISNVISEDGDGIQVTGYGENLDITMSDLRFDNCKRRAIKLQDVRGVEFDHVKIKHSDRSFNMNAGISVYSHGNKFSNVDMDIKSVKGFEFSPTQRQEDYLTSVKDIKIILTSDENLEGSFVVPIDIVQSGNHYTVNNLTIENIYTSGYGASIRIRAYTRNVRIKNANLINSSQLGIIATYEPTSILAYDETNTSHKFLELHDIKTNGNPLYFSNNTTFEYCSVSNFIRTIDYVDPYLYIYNANGHITVNPRRYKRNGLPTSGTFYKGDYVENASFGELGSVGSKYIIAGWVRLTNGTSNVLGVDWLQDRRLTGN